MGDSWKSFKTGFARTKHKVLEKFGSVETTVDTRLKQESEKLFVLFKLIKRLKKNAEKYEDILKNIIVLQNEMAQDILSFKESDTTFIAYQDCLKSMEKERARITDELEIYYHDPLRNYLSQFREIKSRLGELEQRRLDMDRYHRDYTIKANKGKDAVSLAKTEGKHTKTKEGYQTLLEELNRDIDALFDDRKEVFDPVFANYLNRNAEFFAFSSTAYRNVLPMVQHINEYDSSNRSWVVTSVDDSALTKNVRSSSVFTTSPKEYSSSPQGRSRASTIATTSPSSQQDQSFRTSPPLNSQQDLAYTNNQQQNYDQPQQYQPPPQPQYQPPQQPQYQPPPQQPSYTLPNNNGGVNLNKPNQSPPFAPLYPQPNQQPQQPQPPVAKFNQMNLGGNPGGGGGAVGTGLNVSTQQQRKSMYLPNQQPQPLNTQPFKKPAGTFKPAPVGGQPGSSGRPLPTPKAVPNVKKGEALFDFQGLDSTELTFKKGDIISFSKATTGDWYEGELNGARGLVPSNYVKLL